MPGAIRGVYALLDVPHAGGLTASAAADALLAGGAHVLQIRAKQATTEERVEILRQVAPQCVRAAVPLVINDDLEAACCGVEGIWGLHLGQEDLARSPVGSQRWATMRERLESRGLAWGLSTHDLDQVAAAESSSPHYIGFGPVHATRSKSNPGPVTGVAGLAQACKATCLPVVAIGGIDHGNARGCIAAGAAAVAVISCLVAADENTVSDRTRALVNAISAVD